MNFQHIQLLRNSVLAETREAAISAMTEKATTLSDGTPILGRYSVTGTNQTTTVHTLLGLVHKADNADGTLTILADTYDIADIKGKIEAAKTGDRVTLEHADSTTPGVLKTYTIKQGDTSVGTIDIPKDFLVKSGSLVKGTFNEGAFTEATDGADTAIKLVINAQDGNDNEESDIYINVRDLIDVYTGSTGDTVNVTVEGKTIKASLSDSAQTRVNNALTSITVNGQSANVSNNVAAVTVNADKVNFSSDYQPNPSGVVSANTSIQDNIKALEQALLDDETVIAASENHLNDIKLDTIEITGGTVNGGAKMSSGTSASLVIDGSTVKVKNITEQDGDVANDDTIDVALGKLSKKIASNSTDISGKLNKVITSAGINTDGTYKATTGTTTSAAQSIHDAIEALDSKVVANETKQTLTSPNKSITVATADTGTTVDVKVDDTSVKISTEGALYVDTIDGGTY
jgi:hypothetical protein